MARHERDGGRPVGPVGTGEPLVEPVPDHPAATARLGGERALVVADYHAGIEVGLRHERGIELDSASDQRRERLLSLLDQTDTDRLVVVGDLGHRVSGVGQTEREEVAALLDAVPVPVTLVRGNHDTGLAEAFPDRLDVTPATGTRRGSVGFLHGHTWPAADVLAADLICVGHEHPAVKLADEVGRGRTERAWLRGPLASEPFVRRDSERRTPERRDGEAGAVERQDGEEASAERQDGEEASAERREDGDTTAAWNDPELIVVPAFNDRSGGTWVNVEGQAFLAPFLPEGLSAGQAYLLDGTRLGDYRSI
jgi:putative SbcD/Mre11-related phosphoesterase